MISKSRNFDDWSKDCSTQWFFLVSTFSVKMWIRKLQDLGFRIFGNSVVKSFCIASKKWNCLKQNYFMKTNFRIFRLFSKSLPKIRTKLLYLAQQSKIKVTRYFKTQNLVMYTINFMCSHLKAQPENPI